MRRLSVVISDDSLEILADYQKKNNIKTRDEAMDTLLIEFKATRKEVSK